MGVAWRGEIGPASWARWRLPGWLIGEGKSDGEGFEGLRRRLEGEQARDTGTDPGGDGVRRRGMGRGIVDQFRGSF